MSLNNVQKYVDISIFIGCVTWRDHRLSNVTNCSSPSDKITDIKSHKTTNVLKKKRFQFGDQNPISFFNYFWLIKKKRENYRINKMANKADQNLILFYIDQSF